MSKLLLTEKRDQAEKLANAMGWKQGRGCYEGTFEGSPIKVVWARGHLVTLMNPNEVVEGLPWNDPEALLPIPKTFPLKVNDDIPGAPSAAQPKQYVYNIKQHMKGIDEFIIATDSDREGEAIGWLLLKHLGYTGKVRRAWFAAGLDVKSLKDSMASLREPSMTKSWFRASEARSRSDWSYMFLVRAYTFYAEYKFFGNNLGTGGGRERVMSVGRVQTPTLSMIAQRDREIDNFVAKDHFKVSGDFDFPTKGTNLVAEYNPKVTREIIDSTPEGVEWELPRVTPKDGEDLLEKPYYTSKSHVNAFKDRLMSAANQATVSSYKETDRKDNPPKTFSLTDAQSAIASACKISANLAQVILEDLYEQGWTSYARTSKSDLPMNFYEDSERNSLLNSVSQLPELEKASEEAANIHNGNHDDYPKFIPPVFTKKALEHHGIVPTHQVMTPSAFKALSPQKKNDNGKVQHRTEHMQTAYMLVAKQFIQAMYPPATYKQQTIDFEVPVADMLGYPVSAFKATGRILVDGGWRKAFGIGLNDYKGVPSIATGEQTTLTEVSLDAAKTQPPKRYTEVTLPKSMETIGRSVTDPKMRKLLQNSEGLGTPATRKTVIETLVARSYVEVKKGTYYSTPKGQDLVDAVPEWMSSPEQTALWEDYLVKICDEKNDDTAVAMRDDFVNKQMTALESLISEMNRTMKGECGNREKHIATPSKVTPKMKDFIKLICERKKIKAPSGVMSNPKKAMEFINEHRSKNGGKPSEKQLALLDRIISNLPEGTEIPEDIKTNGKACSAFIDKHIKSMPARKPSEKQIELAQKIASNMGDDFKLSDDILNDAKACSAFIDENIKKMPVRPPSEKQIALIKDLISKLPEDEREPENVLTDGKVAREFIDQQFKKNKKGKKK